MDASERAARIAAIDAIVDRRCGAESARTAIPQLRLSRMLAGDPRLAAYAPMLCMVSSGRKRVLLDDAALTYDAGSYLVAGVATPAVGHVAEGPCLGFTLLLEPSVVTELALAMPAPDDGDAAGLGVHRADGDMLDAALRLLRLLDAPETEIAVVAPLILREIAYRLLAGGAGAILRQLASPDSRLSRVHRAIASIRAEPAEPVAIETLATLAGTSVPTFHRDFKAVTGTSPLQFQKRLRLLEARRLLCDELLDAAEAGFRVGYGSASQFSREYSRAFGEPPVRDAARMRGAVARAS